LTIVKQCEGTLRMSKLRNHSDVGSKSIHETNMRHWNDEHLLIDGGRIAFRGKAILFGSQKTNLGASGLLREPDLAHCWEFKFPMTILFRSRMLSALARALMPEETEESIATSSAGAPIK
jgi:hypothetical protein